MDLTLDVDSYSNLIVKGRGTYYIRGELSRLKLRWSPYSKSWNCPFSSRSLTLVEEMLKKSGFHYITSPRLQLLKKREESVSETRVSAVLDLTVPDSIEPNQRETDDSENSSNSSVEKPQPKRTMITRSMTKKVQRNKHTRSKQPKKTRSATLKKRKRKVNEDNEVEFVAEESIDVILEHRCAIAKKEGRIIEIV